MGLAEALGARRDDVLRQASDALGRAHLPHYEASGPAEYHQRMSALLTLVVDCLERRSLAPITEYSASIAAQRFTAGFDISEVQTAFNVLEEAIWRVVIAELPTDALVEATGLVGTVLGAGKDELARTWVSLATDQHVPSLDLAALFEGAAS